MVDASLDEVLRSFLKNGDASSVPLSLCADVAEALADAGETDSLGELARRAVPRLVKKDRLDELEAVWLACCASETLPVAVMEHAIDRLVARGQGPRAEELAVMLIESLSGAGRGDEAVGVALGALALQPSEAVTSAAATAFRGLHEDAPNLQEALSRLAEGGGEATALEAARRALRHAPGTFLQLRDHSVVRVLSTDGTKATVQHPSGAEESCRVDVDPPLRILAEGSHEVRRLFAPDALVRAWLDDPVEPLLSLLAEHSGTLTTVSLKGILVPQIVSEPQLDDVLARLRDACTAGRADIPTYDSRRRLFVAPGATAPVSKKKAAPKRKPPEEGESTAPKARPKPKPKPFDAAPTITAEEVRWVDLTAQPGVRALISGIEGEVDELTRELNVDLPVRLEEARAHGDLRENAEYDAAKDRLAFVQARIEQLRGRLGQLHELSRVRLVPGRVTVMSRVTVADEDGAERRLRITPSELPAPEAGDVSAGTPYARALMGKEQGDLVVVRLPRRTERLEVVAVVDPDEAT